MRNKKSAIFNFLSLLAIEIYLSVYGAHNPFSLFFPLFYCCRTSIYQFIMAPKKKPTEKEQDSSEATLPISANPVETFNVLQAAADSGSLSEHTLQLLELMGAAEAPATPLLMRERFLEFIGRNLAKFGDANVLKKLIPSIVRIISSDTNEDHLVSTAIRCFEGLGAVYAMDKSSDFLARAAIDVLLQVTIDHGAFSFPVRKSAVSALNSLTQSAFPCMINKLFHWISDDREIDTEEQIRKERQTALTRLRNLTLSPSMEKHWTEETQHLALSIVKVLIKSVDVKEFQTLMHAFSGLSSIKEKAGVPLLEIFTSEVTTLSEREIESLSIIGKYIKEGAVFDLSSFLQSKEFFQQKFALSGEAAVLRARCVLLASRISPTESCAVLFQYVFQVLEQCIGADGTVLCDYSILEALLLSLVQLSKKMGLEMLTKLNEEAFQSTMTALLQFISAQRKLSLFAVKKMIQNSTASTNEAELLSCLENCEKVVTGLVTKKIATVGITESWASKPQLPSVKRARDDGKRKGALPPPPGVSETEGPRSKNRRMERNSKRRHYR